jgi:hypothetical protein
MAASQDARAAFTRGLSTHEEAELSTPRSHPSTTTPVPPWIRQTGRRGQLAVGMKTDRIRTDITDIVFVFVFMFGFGFEYG